MYMNGWGLVLIAVVIAAGMLLCRVRGSAQTPRPTVLSFVALALVAVAFGLLVYGIGLTGAGAALAAASIVVPAVVYVAAVRTQMRTNAEASSRIPRKTPVPARRSIGGVQPTRSSEPAAAVRPVFVDIPVAAEDPRNKPYAKAEAEDAEPRETAAIEAKAPCAVQPAAVVPLLQPYPAPQPRPVSESEPELESELRPRPEPQPARQPQPERQPEPEPRPQQPSYEDSLAKARSLKAKGEPAIAARLFAQAADLAADDSVRRSARFEQLACLVKSNAAAQAQVLAEQLRADSAPLTVAERVKLDAVARMM